MANIIDFDRLGAAIKEIEEMFKKADLNILEKDLVIREIVFRINKEKQKVQSNDLLHSMNFKDLIRTFNKSDD